MTAFAKLLLAFGTVMVLISALLSGYQAPGAPEAVMNLLNLGLGALMICLGAGYLLYQKRKRLPKQDDPEEEQPDRKGG